MKKVFTIAIEETFVNEFPIEAESAEEAMQIAEDKFNNNELYFGLDEVSFAQMSIIKPDNEATEWVEI